MNYSIKQLKTFVAVSQFGSFSRAGQAIGLSQSAVSHSIKELEALLGVKLLDRTTREVVLTAAGQRLSQRVEPLLEEMQAALLDTQRYGLRRSGSVRIAASQTLSANLMPQCLAASEQQYPDIQIKLRDRAQHQVLQSIRHAEVDFGIVVDPGQAADLECEPILYEPFLLLCRKDHPLAQQTQVPWSALDGNQLVLQDYDSGSRPLIDRALEQQGIIAKVVQEIGHPATLFPMVSAGIGISVLPALALPLPEGGLLTVRLLVPEVKRALMLARRKNRSLSPAAEVIWQLVRQQAQQLHLQRQESDLY